jgi:hypothetical protein
MFQHALGLRNQALAASFIAAAIFAWPGVATFYYFAADSIVVTVSGQWLLSGYLPIWRILSGPKSVGCLL